MAYTVYKHTSPNGKIYIGITHVEDEENDKYLVHDWRAPICSMFYDYETGPCSYTAPGGTYSGELKRKRHSFNYRCWRCS